MLILSIDPGLNCGTAVAQIDKEMFEIISCGKLYSGPDNPESKRLLYYYGELNKLISNVHIEVIVCEGINRVSGMGHTQNEMSWALPFIYGLIKLLGAIYSIPVVDVNPTSMKKQFTGSGKASKAEVKTKAKEFVTTKISPDTADAIGLAYTYWKLYIKDK